MINKPRFAVMAIVAFQTKNSEEIPLINEPVVNTVIVLLVVTSILGPILTEFFGRQLMMDRDASKPMFLGVAALCSIANKWMRYICIVAICICVAWTCLMFALSFLHYLDEWGNFTFR